MAIKEIMELLKHEANDIKDRIEDLTNGYKKGVCDDVIKEQKKDLEIIKKLINILEKEV